MEVLGIKIGHFYWSAANVASPRTFAADPADPGYWYFYNRSDEAWTSPDSGVAPVSIPGGGTYAEPPAITEMWDLQNNNPCPAGWMVPTYSHLRDMLANSTKNSETDCRIFTDNVDPTQVLTMPLPGQMSSTGLFLPGSWANYAVVTPYPDNIMDTYRFFVAASSNDLYYGGYADAGSVRCVRDDGARYELNVASDNTSEGDGAATLSMFDRSGWVHTIPGLYFGAMAMIEATAEEGYVFDRWVVEEGSGGEFFLPTFPQTFVMMPWEDTRVKATFAVTSDADPGVQIGSTIWASSNLQTLHEFAPRPESPGQFFQFGRGKESYSVNDYGIVVSSSTGASFVVGTSDWDEGGVIGVDYSWKMTTENPCPADWRVPTKAEFNELNTSSTIVHTMRNGVPGILYTDTATGTIELFFPAVGYREREDLVTNNALPDISGYYWTDDRNTAWFKYSTAGQKFQLNSSIKPNQGQSVRCVKKKPLDTSAN